MKLESNRAPAFKFVETNHFVKSVIIYNNDKTAYFPTIENGKKLYFDKIITLYKKRAPGSHLLLCTPKEFIYLFKRKEAIYICECTNDISVSQVKMEFDTFIEDSNKQGKFPKILTALFNR